MSIQGLGVEVVNNMENPQGEIDQKTDTIQELFDAVQNGIEKRKISSVGTKEEIEIDPKKKGRVFSTNEEFLKRENTVFEDEEVIEKKLAVELEKAKKERITAKKETPFINQFNTTHMKMMETKDLEEIGKEYTTVSEKHTFVQAKKTYEIGIAASNNIVITRGVQTIKNMEDRHCVEKISLSFDGKTHEVLIVCIFDGHGGYEFAEYICRNFVKEFEKFDKVTPPKLSLKANMFNLMKIFLPHLNAQIKKSDVPINCGSTALIQMIFDEHVMTFNLGDSAAVHLSEEDKEKKTRECFPVCRQQKPNDPEFERSIQKRGGIVAQIQGKGAFRVNYSLACARSLGDFYLSNKTTQISPLTARPKITCVTNTNGWLIMASDGLWDVCSQEDIAYAMTVMEECKFTPEKMARCLCDCAIKAGSIDNITVILNRVQELKEQTPL